MSLTNTPSSDHEFLLHLFIAGASPNSIRAVRNAKEICEHYLSGRYVLNIIDIHQQPSLACEQQVQAAPMLVRLLPLPRRQLLGDLSNRSRVLETLGLPPSE
jgi:circadian clock protein KaiB